MERKQKEEEIWGERRVLKSNDEKGEKNMHMQQYITWTTVVLPHPVSPTKSTGSLKDQACWTSTASLRMSQVQAKAGYFDAVAGDWRNSNIGRVMKDVCSERVNSLSGSTVLLNTLARISLMTFSSSGLRTLAATTKYPSSARCWSQSWKPLTSPACLYLSAHLNKSLKVMKPSLPAKAALLLRNR